MHHQRIGDADLELLRKTTPHGRDLIGDHLRRRRPLVRLHLQLLRVPGRQRDLSRERDQRRHAQHENSERDQPARSQAAEPDDPEGADRVEDEDVACPEDVGVDESDHQQPEVAPVVQPQRTATRGFRAGRHQHDARPEQEREERHELLVEEQVREAPDERIRTADAAGRRGVHVGGPDHREGLDIDQQDAQHREAAQHVQGDDAIGGGSGAGEFCSGWRLVHAGRLEPRPPKRNGHWRQRATGCVERFTDGGERFPPTAPATRLSWESCEDPCGSASSASWPPGRHRRRDA